MNKTEYQQRRKLSGTQIEVAAMLQISRVTIARRETGALPISREAELALASLKTGTAKSKPNTTVREHIPLPGKGSSGR